MRPYIVNLTNNLISKNRYDEIFFRLGYGDEFVAHVQLDLEAGDIRTMNPETLGKIMASFEIGDVMAGKAELLKDVGFSGDCEELLRGLVARCLAFIVRDRLDDRGRMGVVPPWTGRLPGLQASFKKVLDQRQ